MTRPLAALAALLLLPACDPAMMGGPMATPTGATAPTPGEVAAAAIPPLSDSTSYLCSDGRVVRARYLDDGDDSGRGGAFVDFGGGAVHMIQGVSADGVRYIGGGYQWWTHGLLLASLAPLGPNESLSSAPGVECRANA